MGLSLYIADTDEQLSVLTLRMFSSNRVQRLFSLFSYILLQESCIHWHPLAFAPTCFNPLAASAAIRLLQSACRICCNPPAAIRLLQSSTTASIVLHLLQFPCICINPLVPSTCRIWSNLFLQAADIQLEHFTRMKKIQLKDTECHSLSR